MCLAGVEPGHFLLHILTQSQPGPGWEPVSQHLLHVFPQHSSLLQPLKPWQQPVVKAEGFVSMHACGSSCSFTLLSSKGLCIAS